MNVDWLTHFPTLQTIQSPGWTDACAQARVIQLPAEQPVFKSGDSCRQFLLVLEGSVRVQKLSENGREILLYRVESGQSCILTTACLLGNKAYQAEAFTETPVSAVIIPAPAFHKAMEDSESLREFVFSGYSQRLTELLMLIEAIAFGRLDCRLAGYLLQNNCTVLKTTHQQIARELGTAREVVSRTLKEFEHKGWVRLSRGSIELLQPISLKNLSHQ
ncbi:transcriptional regulator, Crp/Fnr family [Marinobacterium lacunae]|uniref:Transcriptional regulator, Crp/Fnr family n=1 Tax=Marinobacterium lacunae TaxID=1232683 RepID=A0A081FZB2_9GAMM|nr:Crp/Fnr family transcriptional regulator [Marinobacterium lacunae]KEA63867.1 transcriptional regulator, Crp/Fnr family [Marinobacterium lacunae]MBR9885025.1 Crp/Fnr family transcriptional regulator [Oceanospirillales bacterium]